MSDPRRQILVYQLRKCLAQLMKAHNAAIRCGDQESVRELKMIMTKIKKQIHKPQAEKK